jgi:localization factor PodJL
MKSGVPWNFRGLRPEKREPARAAARPSDVSVGEWLNSVIQPADDGDRPRSADFDRETKSRRRPNSRYDERDRHRDANGRRRDTVEDEEPVRRAGVPYREEQYRDSPGRHGHAQDRDRDTDSERAAARAREVREAERAREEAREAERAWQAHEAERVREEAREAERARDESRRAARARAEALEVERARAEARREVERAREETLEAERAREGTRREAERTRDDFREAERMREEREEEARRKAERARREETLEAERIREEAREAERAREGHRVAARAREDFRQAAFARDHALDVSPAPASGEAARNREEVGELHGRLDQISQQLERLAQTDMAQRRLALRQRQSPLTPSEAIDERTPQLTGAPQVPRRTAVRPHEDLPPQDLPPQDLPPQDLPPPIVRTPPAARPPADDRDLLLERAVAEIAARQRALDGKAPVEPAPAKPAPSEPPPAVPPPLLPRSSAPPEVRPAPAEEPHSEGAAVAFESQSARPESPRSESAPVPAVDLSGLERQLRQITSQIEALRPASGLEKAIEEIRAELTEIGHSLTEALPRRAVESLEIEVRALAQRIDHSRQSGVDSTALAGLERGLADVREALRGLTTAESLVGVDQTLQALARKVDTIAAKDDPAALQQLEAAIGGLRGVVSHVASNDALTKVAEDVRALSAKVDGLANNAASGHAVSALQSRIDTLASALDASTGTGQAVSALEGRIDTLANALSASTEAGQAVPKELEKLLGGLIEKLEWVQLTHTDHAALAHLEDRIAMLVKRFDASDARFVHIEAVERGLADLLVHIEQLRGTNGKEKIIGEGGAKIVVGAIERDVAEIKQTERRTQESLEAVQGTVEHVVDRLALIESGIRGDKTSVARAEPLPMAAQEPISPASAISPSQPGPTPAASALSVGTPQAMQVESALPRPDPAAPRVPIDPNLPPDHPLEPGSTTSRSRQPSAADRIAASEAVIGSKPPVIPDPGGKPDFIAAARRAAQAAASTAPERPPGAKAAAGGELPKTLSQRLRKLIVPISVLLILVVGFRVASRLFEGGDTVAPPQIQAEKISPPVAVLPAAKATKLTPPDAPPLPVPAANPAANAEAPLPPDPGAGTATGAKPAGQSLNDNPDAAPTAAEVLPPAEGKPAGSGAALWPVPDITGSLPRPSAPQSAPPAPAAAAFDDKLPATIGGPALRAAALSGDASAAYEVAVRFAEGHGVPQNNEQAARWLERAAKMGLAPAQFRLGGLYEKGIGVKKDLATARDLYRAAADKGHGKAMHNLAVLYAEGVDGAADYRNAAQWFRNAADHGVTDSQYNLGILYARGIGVEQNFAESYKWFVLAANHGDKDAAKKRDEVAPHLDPQTLAAARLAAQNWTAEPQPADATTVKASGAWDPPASAPAAPKPKPRSAGVKAWPSDLPKIN